MKSSTKSPEELRQLYDEQYVERYQRIQSIQRISRLMDQVKLSPSDNVVDFACGDGMLIELVAPHVHTYTGVDFSQQFIDAAVARNQALGFANVKLVCSSIQEFASSRHNAFDVGFAMDFAEHVYDNEWVSILQGCQATLKPQGRLYLHTPNANFFIEIMKEKGILLHQFPDHIAVRTPEQNVALLEKAGFKIKRQLLVHHYNILKLVHPFSFLPVIGKYLKARIFIEAVKP